MGNVASCPLEHRAGHNMGSMHSCGYIDAGLDIAVSFGSSFGTPHHYIGTRGVGDIHHRYALSWRWGEDMRCWATGHPGWRVGWFCVTTGSLEYKYYKY